MPPEDHELRLRDLEKSTAVLSETMRAIQGTLTDIKTQISAFLDKAQLSLAMEGRVERLEDETAELFRKSDATFKLLDSHKGEFASLKAQHEVCMRQENTGSAWWKERIGRFLDAGIIAVVLWLLMIYKGH